MTCKKQTYQNILILLLYIFLRELRALRGYNILFFGCLRYFFEKNRDSDYVTSKKTIPENAKYPH